VVVDAPGVSPEAREQFARDVARGLEQFPGVAAVSPPAMNPKGDLTIFAVTPEGEPVLARDARSRRGMREHFVRTGARRRRS
jgi:hypothetical protein